MLVPSQIVVLLALMLTAGVSLITVIGIPVLMAVGWLRQLALLVSFTETTSPLASVSGVNTLLFGPVFWPLIIHWYAGFVPPLVGVAVNVTNPSKQMVVAVGVTDTAGSTFSAV